MGARRVFLSYRKDDSGDITGRLHDRLRAEFGDELVSEFTTGVPPAGDWRDWARRRIESCDVVLLVIGPNWMGDGGARIHDADDPIRIEAEVALAVDRPVLPLLVRGATMPKASELPKSIRELAHRRALPVRGDPDFHTDVDRLLSAPLLRDPEPQSGTIRSAAPLVAGVLALAALVGGLLLVVSRSGGDDDAAPETPSPSSENVEEVVAPTSATPEATPSTTEVPTTTAATTTTSTSAVPTTEPAPRDALLPEGLLESGEALESDSGRHVLQLAADGALVAATEGVEWWRANTQGAGDDALLIMQGDGNLVLYPAQDQLTAEASLWQTGTHGNNGARLRIRDDAGAGRLDLVTTDGDLIWTVAVVPPLTGMSSAAAEDAVRARGLQPVVEHVPTDDAEVGTVIGQDPLAGEAAEQRVRLTVASEVPAPPGPWSDAPPTFHQDLDAAYDLLLPSCQDPETGLEFVTLVNDGVRLTSTPTQPTCSGPSTSALPTDVSRYAGRIDAATTISFATVGYFSDNLFVEQHPSEVTARSIDEAWPGMPSRFQQRVDAALRVGNQYYVFNGAEFARFASAGEPASEVGLIASEWQGLPDSFKNGIDAAVAFGGKVYLFDGNEYVRFSDVTGMIDEGYPASIGS